LHMCLLQAWGSPCGKGLVVGHCHLPTEKDFMKALLACVLGGLLLGTPLALAGVDIRHEQIQFEKGASAATIPGKIKGDQIVDYSLWAAAGQSMVATLKPSNLSAHFDVLPPGSDAAIFVGATSGNRFEAQLPADGEYTIRVYLMRSAARRNETANYSLAVGIAGGGKTGAGASFDRTLELQGIGFRVRSANQGSINTLYIIPAGLEIDNSPIERTINGTVTGAEAADLNGDGSPEIYV
jgi:hypothetical protein